MAVEKFSISLPEELVADLDEFAGQDALTRSGLIREVVSEYVSKRRSATYEEERHARITRAIEGFERLADEWGPDERSSLDLLHEIREESLGEE
ncbi:MAG: ribbon-helix-helix protein, CopG family [Coriobacteriia bacterium]|nr:ribbon-helix-helix protein, CopG family [Coriobacteriia bacterium]